MENEKIHEIFLFRGHLYTHSFHRSIESAVWLLVFRTSIIFCTLKHGNTSFSENSGKELDICTASECVLPVIVQSIYAFRDKLGDKKSRIVPDRISPLRRFSSFFLLETKLVGAFQCLRRWYSCASIVTVWTFGGRLNQLDWHRNKKAGYFGIWFEKPATVMLVVGLI